MLKNLFWAIYYDDFGLGWLLFTVVLFFVSIILIASVANCVKASNKNFTLKHYILFGICTLFAYQVVPPIISTYAVNTSSPSAQELAINMSVIPWQKGAYYCSLGRIYFLKNQGKKVLESYDNAYKYLQDYSYPCWNMCWISCVSLGDYDKAIETLKYDNTRNECSCSLLLKEMMLAHCYIMKGDLKKASAHIDKSILIKEDFQNLALKAYICKRTGNTQNAKSYYRKALSLCRNNRDKQKVQEYYTDFIRAEKNRVEKIKIKQGLME